MVVNGTNTCIPNRIDDGLCNHMGHVLENCKRRCMQGSSKCQLFLVFALEMEKGATAARKPRCEESNKDGITGTPPSCLSPWLLFKISHEVGEVFVSSNPKPAF